MGDRRRVCSKPMPALSLSKRVSMVSRLRNSTLSAIGLLIRVGLHGARRRAGDPVVTPPPTPQRPWHSHRDTTHGFSH